jgi:hypothetical protein
LIPNQIAGKYGKKLAEQNSVTPLPTLGRGNYLPDINESPDHPMIRGSELVLLKRVPLHNDGKLKMITGHTLVLVGGTWEMFL